VRAQNSILELVMLLVERGMEEVWIAVDDEMVGAVGF